jgi:hypothetical protein
MSHLLTPRVRAAVPVIWHGVKRGYDLLAALAWFAFGIIGGWTFWMLAALPDAKVMQVTHSKETLSETRNLYLGCLVFGVLLAVTGAQKIRNWFRPAPGKE